jgi:tripartite-type tricarboxylate transporter receptor subunit TctC
LAQLVGTTFDTTALRAESPLYLSCKEFGLTKTPWIRRVAIAFSMVISTIAVAAYPDRPVRIVVPYTAGSPPDAVARAIGESLSKRLHQPVVVDNRPGANAMIGMSAVAKSSPDGYTLVLGTMDSHAINPLIYRKVTYDAQRDFAPICMVSSFNMMLVGRQGLEAKTAADLVAYARKHPGKLTYGSWGLGSLGHLWGLQLERAAAISMLHIPFQGTPATLQSLLGEQIDLMFLLPNLAAASQEKGQLKILGSTSKNRRPDYPSVPTLSEQGFSGFVGVQWFALSAPAGTPPEIVNLLNREVNLVLKEEAVKSRLTFLSMDAEGGSATDLAQTIVQSTNTWKKLIDESGFKPLE